MQILGIETYKIDIGKSAVERAGNLETAIHFDSYLKDLVHQIAKGSGRKFLFQRETTEVRVLIDDIMNGGDFPTITHQIASRLLQAEKEAQQKVEKLKKIEIQRGILVQALVRELEVTRFVICKAENYEFLEEVSFALRRGLPTKKKIFKAFVCTFHPDNSPDKVLVYDAHQSSYWWKEFLELQKINSDEDNTENAFDAIDKSILTKIRKKHPTDYVHLRNSTVHYFRSNATFDMTDYLERGIGEYQPFDESLNIEELKEKIRELPYKRKGFDEQFSIVKKKITARFISTIELTDHIDLRLKQDIPNLNSIITAVEGKDGTKYVRIKSDSGFEYFKDKEQGN